jgi:hypothetical protein
MLPVRSFEKLRRIRAASPLDNSLSSSDEDRSQPFLGTLALLWLTLDTLRGCVGLRMLNGRCTNVTPAADRGVGETDLEPAGGDTVTGGISQVGSGIAEAVVAEVTEARRA